MTWLEILLIIVIILLLIGPKKIPEWIAFFRGVDKTKKSSSKKKR